MFAITIKTIAFRQVTLPIGTIGRLIGKKSGNREYVQLFKPDGSNTVYSPTILGVDLRILSPLELLALEANDES